MQRDGIRILHSPNASFDATGPSGRLAELVAHLTGCNPLTAIGAVDHALPPGGADLSVDDRLGIVAHAMIAVRHERRLDLRERRVS